MQKETLAQMFKIVRSIRFISTKRFTKSHEWIQLDAHTATFGITDYAQKVYIEVPQLGAVVKGDSIGSIESVKAASDLYSPVSGELIEINSTLEENPSLVNGKPESDGWIGKIRIENVEDLNDLMDEDAYKLLIK